MSNLDKRLQNLERTAYDAEMPLAAIIIFKCDGAFTDTQQQDIARAESEGRHAVVFRIVDTSEDSNE
jgi:hypothetical protein